MDGPTATRKLREMGCDSFIVGVTGNVLPSDVQHFLRNGANGVIPKPLKVPDLEGLWMDCGVRHFGE